MIGKVPEQPRFDPLRCGSMRTSVLWLNDYLDRPADAAEQAAALTSAGLPLDGGDTAENGEVWQEIETTSNRGDCLCHVGMAREVAAVTGRSVKLPPASPKTGGGRAADPIRVANHRIECRGRRGDGGQRRRTRCPGPGAA